MASNNNDLVQQPLRSILRKAVGEYDEKRLSRPPARPIDGVAIVEAEPPRTRVTALEENRVEAEERALEKARLRMACLMERSAYKKRVSTLQSTITAGTDLSSKEGRTP